jgi:hypothetical protein
MIMVLSHIAEVLPIVLAPKKTAPRTLDDLVQHFEELEEDERPDIDVPMRSLRLTPDGLLEIPERRESLAISAWARKSLSSMLGLKKWSLWFDEECISGEDRAHEVNRRFQAKSTTLRLRRLRSTPPGVEADGTLRALVSPLFTPIPDSKITRILRAALEATFDEPIVVSRLDVTEHSTTYALKVGAPFDSGSSDVGSVAGLVYWLNSHVAARSASLLSGLERLICKNGMRVPLLDAVLWRRAHRAFTESKFSEALVERLAPLPNAFRRGARVLVEARSVRVGDATAVFRQLLEAARVPLKFLPEVDRAYQAEPDLPASAFAISMAITRAARYAEPSARDELERVAAAYLANLYPDVE